MYRQGDILLVPVKGDQQLPPSAVAQRPEDGRHILARGEATGHAHAVAAQTATVLRVGTERWLSVSAPTLLRHEEHGTIEVPVGVYRIVRQREYLSALDEPID